MKVNYKNYLTVLTLVTVCFIACSDDDDFIKEPEVQNFRIKEMADVESHKFGTSEDKLIISYDGAEVDEYLYFDKEDGNWEEHTKYVLSYQGDWVHFRAFKKSENSWDETTGWTHKIKIVNENVLEEEYSFNGNTALFKYSYSNNNLTKLETIENGILEHINEYDYDGNQVVAHRRYSNHDGILEVTFSSEFKYINNQLSEIIDYYHLDNGRIQGVKDNYQYSGDHLIQIDSYYWRSNARSGEPDDWELHEVFYFTYNDNGLLETERKESIDDSEYGYEKTYTYEEGEGNWNLVSYKDIWELFRHPTPKKETIKSFENKKITDMPR